MSVEVDLDRPLRLHPLVFLPDGDEVTIGRSDIDSYGIFPPDGAELVRRLLAGATPRRAADWYASEYGESVNIGDVVGALYELELVTAEDAGDTAVAPPPPVRWRRLGGALFSRAAWCGYAVLAGWTLWLLVGNTDLVPHYQNLFFTDSFSAIELTLFLGQFPAVLLHEAYHALAGRRIGVRSRLGISRRLYFVVFETAMDGLVAVPRRQRYLPMLAGMLADVLWFCGLTLVAHHTRHADGSLSLIGGLCLALAFTTVLRFAWQFYFYLRTDLYAVVSTVLGCVDLQKASGRVLANRFNRLVGRRHRLYDETLLHPVDRRAARWYSWLLLAGYTAMIATLVLAAVPATVTFLSGVLDRLTTTGTPPALVLDAIVFLTLNGLQVVVLIWLAVRDRAGRRRAEPLRHLID